MEVSPVAGATGSSEPRRDSRPPSLGSDILDIAMALMDAVLPATPITASGASSALAGAPEVTPLSPPARPPVVDALRTAVGSLPNTEVQRALLTLVDAAGGDIGRVRQSIEAWY